MSPTNKKNPIMAINDWFNQVNTRKEFGKSLINYASGLAKSAGTALVGNSINSIFENAMMNRQYELNEQAAQNAHQRQLDFWNKQNQYNTPSAQMARLRSAGLNPAMLNGNVVNQAGSLSSVPSASVSKGSSGSQMTPSDVLALAQQKLSTKMLEKQIEAQDIANKRAERENRFEDETYQTKVNTLSETLNSLRLSNASAQRIADYEMDAYYDEDGNLVNNPKALEYTFNELSKNIKQDEELASKFTTYLKDCFGWDYTFLPNYIKADISRYFWNFIVRGENMDGADYRIRTKQIQEAIDKWIRDEDRKHNRESNGEMYNLADDLAECGERFGAFVDEKWVQARDSVVGWAKNAWDNFRYWF